MSAIVFVLALFLSVINFFAEMFSTKIEKHHSKILSLSSGIFVTYLFLALLPESFNGTTSIGENVFLLMLFGFALFHVLEKYAYQHVKNKKQLLEDLSELHAFGFVLDHFLVGMLLFFAVNIDDFFLGLVIILPLTLHVVSSSISLTHINEHFQKNLAIIIALSVSPLIGTLFAFYLSAYPPVYQSLFALSMGAILYVAIRDMLPKDGGKISLFILGILVSIVIIFITKSFEATGLFSGFI